MITIAITIEEKNGDVNAQMVAIGQGTKAEVAEAAAIVRAARADAHQRIAQSPTGGNSYLVDPQHIIEP